MNIDAGGIAFVRVLGPIQVVTTSGRALDLPSASQRRLLARLAVDAPQALRADLLCDVLAVSPGALRTIVSRLRRGFGGTTVVVLIAARRWAEAIAELKAHVSVNPLRDRAWGLLVQALGGAGRQADALAGFREYHAYLAEWVGTEPSAEVRRIQRQIAAGWDGIDTERDWIGERGRPGLSGSPRPARPPSWRGNGWLPLQAELARGPTVVGRAREVESLAAEAARVSESGLRAEEMDAAAKLSVNYRPPGA